MQLRNQLKDKTSETKMIYMLIDEENKQTEFLKDDIRKLNKKLSDVEVINHSDVINLERKRKL